MSSDEDGSWCPQVRDLATAVRPQWARIDAIWGPLKTAHGLHLRRDTDGDAFGFLCEAIAVAQQHGFLRAFAFQLVKDDLVGDGFDEHLVALLGESAAGLHAFQNGVFSPASARIAAQGMLRACDLVCRIDIGEQHIGTGVLVRPQLVATAAHVLWDLFAKHPDGSLVLGPDGSPQAAEGSLARLTLTFGDVEDNLPDDPGTTVRLAGTVAALHPQWLARSSPPTPLERSKALADVSDISGIEAPEGPWDLALIRLAQRRPMPRPVLRGRASRQPFQIHVLHHPQGGGLLGQPLLWSIGKLDRQLGTPPVRWLHDANTLAGSSGAPVFDRYWRIVALHQGGSRVVDCADDAAGLPAASRNRAVPVRDWCERLDELDLVELTYLTELRRSPELGAGPHPVIGRQATQDWVRLSLEPAATAAQRLLIVRGAPGTGLHFTKFLVREMVEDAGGVMVSLDLANALDDDAAAFAGRVAGARSAPARAKVGASGLTTTQRDIRRQVTGVLYGAGSRPTWLVLEGFGGAALDVPVDVRDLLMDLIRNLSAYPSLRLVVIGWLEEPPPGVEAFVDELTDPDAADIAAQILPVGSALLPVATQMAQAELSLEHFQGVLGYAAARRVLERLGQRLRAAAEGPA
ncbi:trypsin-like peptidase domain-containing protein [Dactylosporangium sp. NPDC049742]|uniref:trypsin-like serine peptidase n=1 Tax=Dactylosporangium sp. NPDC049742 TaxID=3154737 RepID=UPI00341CEBF9